MTTQQQMASKMAERRRALASAAKTSKGKPRNKQEMLVHGEERVHDHNTDRTADGIYDPERENEITEWRRHSDLDAPPPRAGYVNRFIRVRLGTQSDSARLRNALREGWRPVKASSLKDNSLPTVHLDQFGDVIGVEDLILCEMPVRVDRQRREYMANRNVRQNAGIERDLKRSSADSTQAGIGPIEQNRNTAVTTRGPRRGVSVADD